MIQKTNPCTTKAFLTLTFILLLVLAFAGTVEARKGVGIKWTLNSLMVSENKETCVDYGVYNPWDEDVNIKLELDPNLQSVATVSPQDSAFVHAQTPSKDSIPVTFCFKVGAVYDKSCLIGDFICSRDCKEELKTFEGEVLALEDKSASSAGDGTGSATSLGVSTTLKLKVVCDPLVRNWYPVIIVVVIIIAFVVAAVVYKRRSRGSRGTRSAVTQKKNRTSPKGKKFKSSASRRT